MYKQGDWARTAATASSRMRCSALLKAERRAKAGDDRRGPCVRGSGRRRQWHVATRGTTMGARPAWLCGARACTRGELGHKARLAQEDGLLRLLSPFSFPSFSNPFSFSISISMLYLGLLCMYTCVAKHVHILMGSTRGQLGY